MHAERFHRALQMMLLFFVAFSVLWKGGKSLETTWLLVAVAWCFVMTSWWLRRRDHPSGSFHDLSSGLWFAAVGSALLAVLSFLVSETKNYGLDEVLRDGSLLLLFPSLVRDARRDPAGSVRLLTGIAMAACVASVIGMGVYVLQPVSRFVGTFFDHRFHTDYWPNAWAQFLLLAWPIVSLWAWRAERRPSRMFRLVLLGVLLGTLLLSYSRGALLTFVGQIILGGLLIIQHHRLSGRSPGRLLLGYFPSAAFLRVCGIVAIALLTFLSLNIFRGQFFEVESLLRKATFTADEGTSSVSERSQFWDQALILARSRPLLGHGPYSFRFLQPVLQEGVYETSDHPHNVFLKFAMERGWPAAILFGVFLAIVILRACAMLRRPHMQHRFLMSVLLLSITGVAAHNLIDYNLQFVGIAVPFIVILALMESLFAPQAQTVVQMRMRRTMEIALLSGLLIVAISEGRTLVLSSLGRHAEARGDAAAALAWYDASKQGVFSRDLQLSHASVLLAEKRVDDALGAIEDYETQNIVDARAWKMRGDVLRLQGDFAAARDAYEVAFTFGRYNYLSILEGLLLVWEDLGDATSPLAAEQDVIETMRRFAQAISRNTHFVALSDNVETFLRITEKLGPLYPDREAELDILAARVDRSAKRERAKIDARRPGMLW